MLEDKIKELVKGIDEQSQLEKIANESFRVHNDAQRKFVEKRQEIFVKRAELGKLMAPLGKNIVLDVNGKTYCVSYSRKGEVAFIYEAITPREADTQLAINKMKYGSQNQTNGTPI